MPVEWVWGIDPAVSRVAFAFAPTDGGPIEVETLMVASDAREGQRLGWLDRQVRIYTRQHTNRHLPACIWVEQPSGRHRNLPLTYATGVLMAALFEASGGVPVWSLPSSAWKLRTVGAGNASKAQVAAWVADRADVKNQDEADAYSIAAAGRAMFVERRWEANAA